VQSVVRMFLAYPVYHRLVFEKESDAAVVIQSVFRAYSASMDFLHSLADVLIVQSIVRRYFAVCEVQRRREAKHRRAVTAIQSAWRRFQCYTDYIFVISDIIVVQNVARRWLATRAANRKAHIIKVQSVARQYIAAKKYCPMIKERAAANTIQKVWRTTLTTLVREDAAVTIQSAWRSFIAYSDFIIRKFEHHAATTIQTHWRGFWQQSHFLILRYEVIRIQALIRGYQEREWLAFQHDCATLIQAGARCYLAKKRLQHERWLKMFLSDSRESIRARHCAKKIVRWWRRLYRKRKKKKAALVIERFFIEIRMEIEREIQRAERKNKKNEARKKKKKESDEMMLERIWLNTMDDDDAASVSESLAFPAERFPGARGKGFPRPAPSLGGNYSDSQATRSYSRATRMERASVATSGNGEYDSDYYGRNRSTDTGTHAPLAPMVHHWTPSASGYRRQDYADNYQQQQQQFGQGYERQQHFFPPTNNVAIAPDNVSTISGITVATTTLSSRFATLSRKELNDDLSLEEAWIDAEVVQAKEKRRQDEQYLRRMGFMKPSANCTPRRHTNNLNRSMVSDGGADMRRGKQPFIQSRSNSFHSRTDSYR